MPAFRVDTAQVAATANALRPYARDLNVAASLIEQLAAAASATGDAACAATYTAMCWQWSDELRRESKGVGALASDLSFAAQLYAMTEQAAVALGGVFGGSE